MNRSKSFWELTAADVLARGEEIRNGINLNPGFTGYDPNPDAPPTTELGRELSRKNRTEAERDAFIALLKARVAHEP